MLRENVRDLMIARSFRNDYWLKGARRLTETESAAALRHQRFVLTRQRAEVSAKAAGVLGQREVAQSIREPILDVLGDHRPRTLEEIERAMNGRGVHALHVFEVLRTLNETGSVALAQDEETIDAARQRTNKLNAFLCERARHRGDACFVASPVTGGARLMDRHALFFLSAIYQGKTTVTELAAHAAPMFDAAGMAISVEGKNSLSADHRFAGLGSLASTFLEKEVPILKALQIV
jgi:hypothetical protein